MAPRKRDGPIRTKDRRVYGMLRFQYSRKLPQRKPKEIPPELKTEILRLLSVVQGPGQTVSSLIQNIDRRLNQPQSREAVIRMVLVEAAANGEIRLPDKTNAGGPRKKGGQQKPPTK